MAKGKTKTSAQIVVDSFSGETPLQQDLNYEKYRKMRRDPTIALARDYAVSPILASTWTFEGADEEKVKVLEDQLLPLRSHLLRLSLLGEIDFGWKAFEKTFSFNQDIGFTTIARVKALKNDITKVRYEKDTGKFIGLSSVDLYTGEKYWLDASHSLFVNFDDEGLGTYAEPKMRRAENAYDSWNDVDEVAKRYDKKMAGTYLVVQYPIGETEYSNKGGALTNNAEIADDIIKAMRSSGAVAIPIDVDRFINDLSKINEIWKVYFLDPQAKQSSFVDRQKYLDVLKVRAFGITERAILEGTYGTKAEATAHASATLLCLQLKHEQLTEFFNWHLVNQLLRNNWDEENTVRIVAQPLADDRQEVFTALFTAMLADPGVAPEIYKNISIEQTLRALKIPLEDSGIGIAYEKVPETDTTGDDWRDIIETYGDYDAQPALFSQSAAPVDAKKLVKQSAALEKVIAGTKQRLVRSEIRAKAAVKRVTKHKQTLTAATKKKNALAIV